MPGALPQPPGGLGKGSKIGGAQLPATPSCPILTAAEMGEMYTCPITQSIFEVHVSQIL